MDTKSYAPSGNPIYPSIEPYTPNQDMYSELQQIHTVQIPQDDLQDHRNTANKKLPASMIEPNLPDRQNFEVIVLERPMLVDGLPVIVQGRSPQLFYCINCKSNKISHVVYDMGAGSWLVVGISLFCCPFFACLPCCIEGCQDAVHICPACFRVVGRNNFLL